MKNKHLLCFFLLLLLFFIFSCSEENHPPVLVILANPTSGDAPLSVQFQAQASDPDSNTLFFQWNFGDGSTDSNVQNPLHVFADVGVFTATCTVTDNGSPRMRTSKTTTITVSALPPTLSALNPAWKVAHLPEFTLAVTGTNFIPSSKIVFNGVEKTTELVSASEIHCKIAPEETDVFSAKDLSSTENSIKAISESTLGVWVRNPSPGGDSQPLNLTVKSYHSFGAPELVCSDFSESYSLLFRRYLYLIYRPGTFHNMKLMISKDNGKTWLPSVEIPHSSNDLDFSFAVDNSGILYCVNLETGSSYADVMLAKSSNDGATWTENRLICQGTPESGLCNHTAQNINIIVLNDDSLHVTWMEHGVECGGSHNYYIRSTDHGNTWSERRQIPASNDNTYYPVLLGNGYNMLHYISYIGGTFEEPSGPYYQYSQDKGLSWSDPVVINPDGTSEKIPCPGPDGKLYLPYLSTVPIKFMAYLKAQVSKDHGSSWELMSCYYYDWMSVKTEGISFLPDPAGNVNVLLSLSLVHPWAVYYSRITGDLSSKWKPYVAPAISPEEYKTGRNSYAVDAEGNLYIITQSTINQNELYLIRSDRDE
jgi:PKD repeat protein